MSKRKVDYMLPTESQISMWTLLIRRWRYVCMMIYVLRAAIVMGFRDMLCFYTFWCLYLVALMCSSFLLINSIKVSLAAQTLSSSVAVALRTFQEVGYAELKRLCGYLRIHWGNAAKDMHHWPKSFLTFEWLTPLTPTSLCGWSVGQQPQNKGGC